MLALTVDMQGLISASLGTMPWMQGTVSAYCFFQAEGLSLTDTGTVPALCGGAKKGFEVEGQWM